MSPAGFDSWYALFQQILHSEDLNPTAPFFKDQRLILWVFVRTSMLSYVDFSWDFIFQIIFDEVHFYYYRQCKWRLKQREFLFLSDLKHKSNQLISNELSEWINTLQRESVSFNSNLFLIWWVHLLQQILLNVNRRTECFSKSLF